MSNTNNNSEATDPPHTNESQVSDITDNRIYQNSSFQESQTIEASVSQQEMIPPSPRGSQLKVEQLLENAVLINPTIYQQRIIEEINNEETRPTMVKPSKDSLHQTQTNQDSDSQICQQQQTIHHNQTIQQQQQHEQLQQDHLNSSNQYSVIASSTNQSQTIQNEQTTITSLEQNNGSLDSAQSTEQAASPETIRFSVDIFEQTLQGNLLPWSYAISNKLIPPLTFDPQGYHLLHRAASLHQLDIVISLIELYEIPVDLTDTTNAQTALMICSLYGNVRMMKYLLDKGANINAHDTRRFTPLMNTVLNQFTFASLYLMSRGANFSSLDADGCTLAHRAAFNNQVVMLQILAAIPATRSQLDQQDTLHLTPIGRAINNDAHAAFQFLQSVHPIPNLTKNTLTVESSKCMSRLIDAEIEKQTRNERAFTNIRSLIEFIKHAYSKKAKEYVVVLYACLIGCLYYVFVLMTGVMYNRSTELHYFCNVVHGYTLLFLTYVSIFALKMECPSKKIQRVRGKNSYPFEKRKNNRERLDSGVEYEQEDDIEELEMDFDSLDLTKVDFKYLDNLFMNHCADTLDQELSVEGSDQSRDSRANRVNLRSRRNVEDLNLIDWVAALVGNDRVSEVEQLRESSICFQCLKFKPYRSHHCMKFNVCVPLYSHYSSVFGKLIVQDVNQVQFYTILLLQWVLLALYFIANLLYCKELYAQQFGSYSIFAFAEVIYIFIQHEKWLFVSVYLFAHVLMYLASVYFVLESICLWMRITRQELLEPQNYAYFFREIQRISRINGRNLSSQELAEAKFVRIYENPFSRCQNFVTRREIFEDHQNTSDFTHDGTATSV